MDSDGVPVDLDYTKVEAISARRTNAFVNNYLTTCTHFLNRYIATCEEQLAEIESSEMQLTALVNALEHKLNSVASLAASNESSKPPTSVTTTVSEVPNQIPEPSTVVQETPAATSTPETPSNMIAVSKHPRYKKFFDLKKYGVSDPQIQLNMRNNGIDPSMVDLDKPDLLVPYEDVPQDQDSDSSSSTSSSFDD